MIQQIVQVCFAVIAVSFTIALTTAAGMVFYYAVKEVFKK